MPDSIEKRLEAIWESSPGEMTMDALTDYVLDQDGFVRDWAERLQREAIKARLRKVLNRTGQPELPMGYAVEVGKGETIWRKPAMMDRRSYERYVNRHNRHLVLVREKTKLSRDVCVEQFDDCAPLCVVGLAIEDENQEVVRVRPIQLHMMDLEFGPSRPGVDEEDEPDTP